ncbi:MAG: hypothetical protein ACI9TH_001312 [Kiritimatiellia bacterium]|jgi:hypothetical protein
MVDIFYRKNWVFRRFYKNRASHVRKPVFTVVMGMNDQTQPEHIRLMTSTDWITLGICLAACLHFMAMILWVG